jgi:hypothetical protein
MSGRGTEREDPAATPRRPTRCRTGGISHNLPQEAPGDFIDANLEVDGFGPSPRCVAVPSREPAFR